MDEAPSVTAGTPGPLQGGAVDVAGEWRDTHCSGRWWVSSQSATVSFWSYFFRKIDYGRLVGDANCADGEEALARCLRVRSSRRRVLPPVPRPIQASTPNDTQRFCFSPLAGYFSPTCIGLLGLS